MSVILNPQERYFVNTFVMPNRRERMLFELSSEKKRADCVWRFAHNARDILFPARLCALDAKHGELLMEGQKLVDRIGENRVFSIHFDSAMDRKTYTFSDALEASMGHGPYILIDCRQKYAFVETEPFCESHEYLFLQG